MPIQTATLPTPDINGLKLKSTPVPALPLSTQQTAVTKTITTPDGTALAYRLFGAPATTNSPPLLLLQHFRGSMDHWDPSLINALAPNRTLLLLDYAGVGKSTGTVASTYTGWADSALSLLTALQIPQVDVLGYSMGGLAAQMLALDHPEVVRKMVLAATSTSIGPERVDPADLAAFMRLAGAVTDEEQLAANAECYYPPTAAGRLVAKDSWDRIHERSGDRSGVLGEEGTTNQVASWMHFSAPNPANSYERLEELRMPVFVANGDRDTLMPTANTLHLARRIPNVQMAIYPGAGHGFISQHGGKFAGDVAAFLDEEAEAVKEL